jgi:WD40 repeat protein
VTCGGSDATPKLWDIQTKQCTASFIGHKGRVFALAANFDEHLLVTAGSGSTFRCWVRMPDMCTCWCLRQS